MVALGKQALRIAPDTWGVKAAGPGGSWVAQPVEHLTLAQVTISQLMSSSPVLGSALTAQSLEPASDSVSPSLFAPPLLALSLSLSLSKINEHLKFF